LAPACDYVAPYELQKSWLNRIKKSDTLWGLKQERF
jgi:hypothetical protein